jgi:fatty acid desaturase
MPAKNPVPVRWSLKNLPPRLTAKLAAIWGTIIHAGKPTQHSRLSRLRLALTFILVGLTFTALGLVWMPWTVVLLPLGWIFTIGGSRYLQVSVVHFAVHNQVFARERHNRLLAQTISTVLLITDFDTYHRDHVKNHHPIGKFARRGDPDLEFLIALGFLPGMSRNELWRHLAWTLVSPRFHFLFLRGRLYSNFVGASRPRRLAAIAFWLAVAIALAMHPMWIIPFIVLWILPLTLGYHMSSILQFASEHLWLLPCTGEGAREHAKALTRGRFCGDALPDADLRGVARLRAWARWWLRLLTLHAVVRVAVLPGDLTHHDLHHLRPTDFDWPNADAVRFEMLANGETLNETWGLFAALDEVFVVLSSLPPMNVDEPVVINEKLFGTM